MVSEILFLTTLFVTRLVLPIVAMLALGALVERKLNLAKVLKPSQGSNDGGVGWKR
ncbi:MAG: hypothetical protein HY868_16385 [Chloroflexi bacterium]|nr:hypothetical protein [Chloroflexota bacterium]